MMKSKCKLCSATGFIDEPDFPSIPPGANIEIIEMEMEEPVLTSIPFGTEIEAINMAAGGPVGVFPL